MSRAIVKRIIFWTSVVLLMLVTCIVVGILYVWYIGGQENQFNVVDEPIVSESVDRQTPASPSAGAPVSASIQYLKSPVSPSENTTLSVKTTPTAECTPTVLYNEVPSADSGLKPKVADEYGVVSWTWTVDASAPNGEWPVEITCVYEKRDAFVRGHITVE